MYVSTDTNFNGIELTDGGHIWLMVEARWEIFPYYYTAPFQSLTSPHQVHHIDNYSLTNRKSIGNWVIIKKKRSFSVTDIFQEDQTSVLVHIFGAL